MVYNEKAKHEDTHRWVVLGVISSVYFLVYFHRVSTSVIAPDLLSAFQIRATVLGFMSSMYFYPYALEQPLAGYLSDSLGPRRVVGLWSLVATLTPLLFSAWLLFRSGQGPCWTRWAGLVIFILSQPMVRPSWSASSLSWVASSYACALARKCTEQSKTRGRGDRS